MTTNLADCAQRLQTDGYRVFPGAVPMELVERMRADMQAAYAWCRRIQMANGIDNAEHTVHHLIGTGMRSSFLEYLDTMAVRPYVSNFFRGRPFILQSIGGNFNPPGGANYAAKIHRDIRSWYEAPLMLNTIVALDDLTEENGATWLMPGSHQCADRMDEAFEECAIQVTAPAGSVILFDSRVWHRAGVNRSQAERRIITPIFTVPFYKPGFDYCRALGYDIVAGLSEELRQVLGYNARVPATLGEWYQPPERRFYKGDQG